MDEIIKKVAAKYGVNPELLRQLIQVEQGKVHLERRRGAKDELRQVVEAHLEASKQ